MNDNTVCMQYILDGRKRQIRMPLHEARHHHRWILEQSGTIH
jgi:hypothetical protein